MGLMRSTKSPNLQLFSKRTSSILAEYGIKGSDKLLFVFLENPLCEVCLIRIKEQVDEERNTVCTHRYADCLLKNTSTKDFQLLITPLVFKLFLFKDVVNVTPPPMLTKVNSCIISVIKPVSLF